MLKLPALKVHTRGQFFTYWGGRWRYFGTDRAEAERRYAEHIRTVYLPWLQEQETLAARRAAASRRTGKRALLIVDVVQLYLEDMADRDLDPETIRAARRHLRHLLHVYGEMPAAEFHVQLLVAMRRDLKSIQVPEDPGVPDGPQRRKYSPKSLNHMTNTVKGLFRYATTQGVPSIDLSGCRSIRLAAPTPKVVPLAEIVASLARVREGMAKRALRRRRPVTEIMPLGEELAHWLSLAYLGAMRPTHLVRLVAGEGVWTLAPGPGGAVFRLDRAKTANSRHVLLSPEALTHLAALQQWPGPFEPCAVVRPPRWRKESTLRWATRTALGAVGWPHVLRHSAATHLGEMGVLQEDIDNILGHCTPGVLKNYLRVARERLLPAAARLTLRSSPSA